MPKISGNQGVPVLTVANKNERRILLRESWLVRSSSASWVLQPTCVIVGGELEEGLEKLYDVII